MKLLKINNKYILKTIGDNHVIFPASGEGNIVSKMMLISETGYLLWTALEKGADRNSLLQVIMNEYDVAKDAALADIDDFLLQLKQIGVLEC